MTAPFFPALVDQYAFQNSGQPPWFYFAQPLAGFLGYNGGSGYQVGDVVHPDVPLTSIFSDPSLWTVATVDGTGYITSFESTYYDAPYLYTDYGTDLFPNLIGGSGTGANYGHADVAFNWTPLISCDTPGAGMASTVTQMTICYWTCGDLSPPDPNGGVIQGSQSSPLYTDFPTISPAQPSDGVTISAIIIGGFHDHLELSIGVSLCQDASTFPTQLYQAIHGGFIPLLDTTDSSFRYRSINFQVMVSFDTAAQVMQVYVNDTLVPVVSGPEWSSAGVLNNAVYTWSASSFNALGDLWITDQMIDLSITGNRRKWINADLSAVNLPSNGALSGGPSPKVFLHTTATGSPATFSDNNGSGPGWQLYSPALYPSYLNIFAPIQPNYSVSTNNLIPLEFHENDGCLSQTPIPPPPNPDKTDLAELWFATTPTFIDLTTAANRRKFISSQGGALDLGANGENPFGAIPPVYLTARTSVPTFPDNAGAGGSFPSTGTIGPSPSNPPPGLTVVSTTPARIVENGGVLGDYRNGNLYAFNEATYTDNGTRRVWIRRWRALPEQTEKSVRYSSLAIQMQTGAGMVAGAQSNLMLRWSDDGGHTWAGERIYPLGDLGETAFIVKFNRLGMTRRFQGSDRIFELSSTDPFKVAILDAEVKIS